MNLGQFLTENLLTLLAFDKERAKIIRNTVDPGMFAGVYREIAARIYNHLDKHKEPPGEHLADLFEEELTGSSKKDRSLYEDILGSMHEAKDTINSKFVMSHLETFVKRQTLRSFAVDIAKELQKDTEDSLERAEELIHKVTTQRLSIFDAGLRLSETDKVMKFLDLPQESFPLKIPAFDKRGFGLSRGELFLYIADTKTGKTWMMIHLAKIAAMLGLKVLHVSLEMSEERIAQRYAQTFFAMAKRNETITTQRFVKNDSREIELEQREIKPSLSLDDPKIAKKLRKKLKRWANRTLKNVVVKQFPTSKLTIKELEAYMDHLADTEGFTPDILIVDYPDLMTLPGGAGQQVRHGLSALYKGLRGVGVDRNCAVAAPTQSNRSGSGAKQVNRTHVSEAYSKIADADVVMTYSQTEAEKTLGLARLTVVAGRNDEDNITVIISQAYGIGQFALDSKEMDKSYWQYIDDQSDLSEVDDDDDGFDDDE